MKFYVKNEFIYQSVRVFRGQVVDIKAAQVEHFRKCNVLGDPVKEEASESATSPAGEKAVKKSKPKRGKKA
jgi:hypothetical protein